MELLVARNPDPSSRLPFLVRVPLEGGLVFRTSGTWPRTKALYCYPVPVDEWPRDPDIVERVPLRQCTRRGAAIDLVLDRRREQRSQLVFTTARGRDAVFWQSPRTRKQARPNVRTPTARAAGLADLEILVDTRERYPYRFTAQQVRTRRVALAAGDYAVRWDDAPVAADVAPAEPPIVGAVERKTLSDLVTSLVDGRLRYLLGELATLPRAALVVEDRYSAIFKLGHVRPAGVADGLAELQVRWPSIPIVFLETRKLSEEWTYRYLAASLQLARDDDALDRRFATVAVHPVGSRAGSPDPARHAEPTSAELRAWARQQGLVVADRGRIPAVVRGAWERAHGYRTD